MCQDEHERRKARLKDDGFWSGIKKGDYGAAMNALGFPWPAATSGGGLSHEQFLALAERIRDDVTTKIQESRLISSGGKDVFICTLTSIALDSPTAASEMHALRQQIKTTNRQDAGPLLFRKVSDFDTGEIENDLISLARACWILAF
jgi:hypothetical protein